MGSNTSKNVGPMQTVKRETGASSNNNAYDYEFAMASSTKTQLNDLKDQVEQAESHVTEIEKQKEALESKKLDLEEVIESLEAVVLQYKTELNDAQGELVQKLHEKEKLIEYLHLDSRNTQQSTLKLKSKYKKKLKALTRQLYEAKQEHMLEVYELKQELSQIENSRCPEDMISTAETRRDSLYGRESLQQEPNSNRTKVILELSSKVSEQGAKITELEKTVNEQKNEITSLQRQNPCDDGSYCIAVSTLSPIELTSTPNYQGNDYPTLRKKSSEEEEIYNELTTINEEMTKLYGRNNRRGSNKEVYNYHTTTNWDADMLYDTKENEEEQVLKDRREGRKASGVSRDSGRSSTDADLYKTPNWDCGPYATDDMTGYSGDSKAQKSTRDRQYTFDPYGWTESDEDIFGVSGKPKKSDIRQVSAPKHKKKASTPDYQYIDGLLNQNDKFV